MEVKQALDPFWPQILLQHPGQRNTSHRIHLVLDLKIRQLQDFSFFYIFNSEIRLLLIQVKTAYRIVQNCNLILYYSLEYPDNKVYSNEGGEGGKIVWEGEERAVNVKFQKEDSWWESKKCAKSSNLKNRTINQMTYIKQFLSQHIISYYLSVLQEQSNHDLFVNHQNQNNFFSLTSQILLFGDNIPKTKTNDWLIQLITTNLLIEYEDLKNTKLVARETDSDCIKYIKSNFKYIYIQMHQIMIRLILAYLKTSQQNTIDEPLTKLGQEIGFIYPALKTQISYNFLEINLTDWFKTYLQMFLEQKTPKPAFFQFLQVVKYECNLLGPLEKIFDQIINQRVLLNEREYEPSVCQSKSDALSKISQDRIFNDIELLRKRKKICKQKYKNTFSNTSYLTPSKERQQFFPETQKTGNWMINENSSSCQNQQSTSSLSKLLKKYKKPLVRTIYHGSIKAFVPKRQPQVNEYFAQQYIEKLTAVSSLTSNESLPVFDINRKRSSKKQKYSLNQSQKTQFYVPQTPKQQYHHPILLEEKKIFLSKAKI